MILQNPYVIVAIDPLMLVPEAEDVHHFVRNIMQRSTTRIVHMHSLNNGVQLNMCDLRIKHGEKNFPLK
uniref:Uncharacterized protein n=1 Tax=Romanomermis culicivorax TaxID=13658 RepID=A0A915KK88_ROMCU